MTPCGLLIFDLDGTLFQTQKVSIPAVQYAFSEAGLRPPGEESIRQFFGRPDPEFWAWLRDQYAGITETILDSIPEWEVRLIPELGALYPGVVEALAQLRLLSARMVICSNGYPEYVTTVVESHGLERYFDYLRWREPTDQGKSQMVRDLLEKFPERPAIIIGDRADDIAAARENGLLAVASLYGFGKPEELAQAHASAASPSALPGLLQPLLYPNP